MVAYLIDIAFIWLLLSLLQNLIVLLLIPLFALMPTSDAMAGAAMGLISFTLINAYFIVFEWTMGGQTPGKRTVGIRVIKEGGYSLRFLDTLVRNLLRIVDFLPMFYGVGLTSMLLTSRSQRLGDVVSGTLLVHQRAIGQQPPLANLPPASAGAQALPPERVASLPQDVIGLIARYFEMLDELAPRYRQEIAVELQELVRQSTGLAPEGLQSAEAFLADLMHRSEQIVPA